MEMGPRMINMQSKTAIFENILEERSVRVFTILPSPGQSDIWSGLIFIKIWPIFNFERTDERLRSLRSALV